MESMGIGNKHPKKSVEAEPTQSQSSSGIYWPPVANGMASPDTLARVLLSETVACATPSGGRPSLKQRRTRL
jgi:hypothetical protein